MTGRVSKAGASTGKLPPATINEKISSRLDYIARLRFLTDEVRNVVRKPYDYNGK